MRYCSWLCHSRPPKGGEEEDWSCEGQKDAGMGQEIVSGVLLDMNSAVFKRSPVAPGIAKNGVC